MRRDATSEFAVAKEDVASPHIQRLVCSLNHASCAVGEVWIELDRVTEADHAVIPVTATSIAVAT